jgi:pantoate--beta-alanine ligase
MLHIAEILPLRRQVKRWKLENKTIALVPTMGNLHVGHIELVVSAKERADKVVVSIFVNPIQFDKKADLQAYPQTLEADKEKLALAGCDLVFTPSVEDIYPDGDETTRVEVPILGEILEGASRLGHFSGVSTIVNKLFNMVMPDFSIFGQKDFQQLLLVKRMVADLNMPIKIIGLPTVRETDGLAMSSRNGYLTKDERCIAPLFQQQLQCLVVAAKKGNKDFKALQIKAAQSLNKKGFRADYIEVRRVKDFQIATTKDTDLVVVGAVWLGKARLLDNIRFLLK